MLVSVLPFRRTRYKSQLMIDLTILPHGGLGLLATAWSPGASPASHGAAQEAMVLHSPQDSAALLSGGTLNDRVLFRGCYSQVEQEEVVCPHLWLGREVMANWLPDWYCFCSIKKAWKHHVFTAVSGPFVYPVHSGSTVLSDHRSRSPWGFCLFNGSYWKKIFLKPQIQ